MSRAQVTAADVARRAGVSTATVSFVVNGTKPVSRQTRQRVETAMRELRFAVNPHAQALASRRSKVLALAFPVGTRRITTTGSTFFVAAAERARQRGHQMVLWPLESTAEAISEVVDTRLLAGVVLMEVLLDDPRVAALDSAGLPFALIGRTRDTAGVDFVDIDFDSTMRDALERVRGLGHRRVALVHARLPAGFSGYGATMRTRS
ncbi:MAG: LacI family DNA-binding transcriptional regulator, partial [Dermatophilaceae bacterium]